MYGGVVIVWWCGLKVTHPQHSNCKLQLQTQPFQNHYTTKSHTSQIKSQKKPIQNPHVCLLCHLLPPYQTHPGLEGGTARGALRPAPDGHGGRQGSIPAGATVLDGAWDGMGMVQFLNPQNGSRVVGVRRKTKMVYRESYFRSFMFSYFVIFYRLYQQGLAGLGWICRNLFKRWMGLGRLGLIDGIGWHYLVGFGPGM